METLRAPSLVSSHRWSSDTHRWSIGLQPLPVRSPWTGSNGGISLFDRALESPDVKAALVEEGEIEHAGARGSAKAKTYSFEAPVGFGPFSLPADDKRFANIGNRVFADMKLTILLDYRARKLTFYGSCPAS